MHQFYAPLPLPLYRTEVSRPWIPCLWSLPCVRACVPWVKWVDYLGKGQGDCLCVVGVVWVVGGGGDE